MDNRLKIVGIRLREYLIYKKIGINQFGRMTSTSGAQISNIINGKNYGIIKLLNILHACPDLNISWLLHGNGSMILTSERNETHSRVSLKSSSLDADLNGKIKKSEEERKNLALEIEKLKLENSSLEGVVTYQDMTIEAYKNTISILSETNQDIRELLQHYKSALATETVNRKTA